MEFRVLGPLEATDDTTPLALGRPKPRALLARLLLDVGRTVSVEALVDDLWGEDVPDSAVKMVQMYVSQLRKVLPADVLVTRAPGYALEVEPEAVDVVRFVRLREEGARRGRRPAHRLGATQRGAGAVARPGAGRVLRAVRSRRGAAPGGAAPAVPGEPDRGRPRRRPPRRPGRRAGGAGRPPPAARGAAGPADAGALPRRPAGRGALRLRPLPADARRASSASSRPSRSSGSRCASSTRIPTCCRRLPRPPCRRRSARPSGRRSWGATRTCAGCVPRSGAPAAGGSRSR